MNQADSITTQEFLAGVNDPYHIFTLFLIMVLAGVLGGAAGYMIEKNTGAEKTDITPHFYILIGICASFLVPLFMTTISSDLLENSQQNHLDYFVFGGFCLIAAISAHKFILSISEKILKQFENTTQKIETAGKKLEKTELRKDLEKDLTTLIQKTQNGQYFYLTKDRATTILDRAIILTAEDEKTYYLSELIKHYFSAGKYELINEIVDTYSGKIKLDAYTWANVAIANMNMYSKTQDSSYRAKSKTALQSSSDLNYSYGEPHAIHIYLNLVDFASESSQKVKDEIKNRVLEIFEKIMEKSPETSYDAYQYFIRNDGNAFKKYNDILRELFPDQFQNLQNTALSLNIGEENNPNLVQ